MLKLCDKNIVKPVSIISSNCKLKKTFPNLWKKADIVLIRKKGEKDLIKNYRPVSLLLIFGRFFERLIFNFLFKYFDKNELLSPNQSSFCPFDSCVNQVLSINHETFSNFDSDLPKDIHAVFLDISKVFGTIWLPGLIFNIRALNRPYRDRLTALSQLKLVEYFLNWVFPKLLNPIKLKNKYYWFFVHTHVYKLQFDYDHLLITILHYNY